MNNDPKNRSVGPGCASSVLSKSDEATGVFPRVLEPENAPTLVDIPMFLEVDLEQILRD
jgi:hypothetical protein